MEKLTIFEAFYAMTEFLDIYYESTGSDDLGSLLGDMQMHPDGNTWDPATLGEWIESVEEVLAEKPASKMQFFTL